MTYYLFDSTGLFVGVSDVEHPRSTTIEPIVPPGHLAYWSFGFWSYVKVSDIVKPALALGRRITKMAFRRRFTTEEKEGIELAALDQAQAAPAARRASARLRAYQQDILAAEYIDLDRDDVRLGVQGLEAAGLIQPGRAAAILDSEVTPEEVAEC